MAAVNETNYANAIKTQYERRLLTRALPRLIHSRWGLKGRLNGYGSYEWRKYGSLSAVTSALTEGTTPSEQSAPSLTLVTATPLWYGAWIGYTDEITMTAFDPLVSEVSGILGEQCGLSIDTLVRNTLTAGATKDYSGNVAARASLDAPTHDVTYADFLKQYASLEAENARGISGDDYVVILHPHTVATLFQDPTWVNLFIHAEGGKPMKDGYIGRIFRCQIYVSSNAREYADGGVSNDDVYSMLFLAGESYGVVGIGNFTPKDVDNMGKEGRNMTGTKSIRPVEMILKSLGSAGADDPLNQRGTIAWKASLDVDVLNSAWVRDLEHTNTFSAD